ncbi:MAG: DinB family protein [Blastocatellia bacterium]
MSAKSSKVGGSGSIADEKPLDFNSLQSSLRLVPETLKNMADSLSTDTLSIPASDNDWSFLEHVCHLRDIESEGYSVRIRRILAEEDPVLLDIDGARLAAERNYMSEGFANALAAFTRERMQNVETVSGLSIQQLNRTAKFGDAGPITLLDLLGMIFNHDQEHLKQLEELLGFLSSDKDASA